MMKLLIIILLLSSCTKEHTCWQCQGFSVAGIHYNDTTICGKLPPPKQDANGNDITPVCTQIK